MTVKRLVLCILDGWGVRDNPEDNGLVNAKSWNRMLKTYPWTTIQASETYVGLPKGQMGNSEVGHMSIGLGRVVIQDLPRIDQAIADDSLKSHVKVQSLIKTLKQNNKACNLLGLLSPGGVHSHQDHIVAAANLLADERITVNIHAFLDGRDTPPQSALKYIGDFQSKLKSGAQIVSLGGRYFAMDRDKRWDRVALAYETMVMGKSDIVFDNSNEAIEYFYKNNITDEFIPPVAITNYSGMKDGEGLWMVNFRSDRVRQILSALLQKNFAHFPREKIVNFSGVLGMTEYSDALLPLIPALFEKIPLNNGLGEIISNTGQKQVRIAETEKYAHVTFFFNGGREEPFGGESRILVPSPKVATYDLEPKMSAKEVTDHVIDEMRKKESQLIVVNYANTDMVGHTGIKSAIEEAVSFVDSCVERLEKVSLETGWILAITADHGNAELMIDSDGRPHTAHTCNPVPFMVINGAIQKLKQEGSLCDVAPTVLDFLDYKQPKEMTGHSLSESL
ncbi:MAG: 2,3-bisphosphoglycerate-independent phosphoglycerate mutase [Alphaproteobacteria bacterium]|nr:2,3-bisphosphoglycerate-independent phosphoglycerate mutase [Alphaproteobacteria bacterium]